MTTSDYCIELGSLWLGSHPCVAAGGAGAQPPPISWGFSPVLPLAAVAVAVLEGGVAGAGFGLAVGVLCDAVYFGASGAWTIGMALLGTGAGVASRFGLRQNLAGCLLCSLTSLVIIDAVRVFYRLLTGVAGPAALLAVAVPEVLWSLLFVFPVYALFRWVFNRVPKRTVF